jgi:cellulose synthase/poly-beta-1,6-N-acetylglucosamine synthase-like glycosyltransferase
MTSLPCVAYLLLAGLALVQAGLFTFQAVENRRFCRARCRRRDSATPCGHVLLLAPCKGNDTGLRDNLEYLLAQDYPDFEVRFIVESRDDPAHAIIRDVIASRRDVRATICIAGEATDGGQKVHNLRAATSDIPAETRYLAFVDSDARPAPHWLRSLISRFDGRELGAVTGYRWFVPAVNTPANLLLSAINANVAGLLGPGGHHFVWGGSWAIERHIFEEVGLRDAWQGTLSDDLVATRVLRAARLPIEFEPRCLVPSPLDVTLGQAFEFLRRQYLIGRFYATRYWLGALAIALLAVSALWLSLAAAVAGGAMHWSFAWIPAVGFVVLAASHVARAWLRQSMPRYALPSYENQLRACRWFDIAAAPLAGLVNLTALLSSLVGNTIAWRGIRYRLLRGGQARRLRDERRLPEPATIPMPIPTAIQSQADIQRQRLA